MGTDSPEHIIVEVTLDNEPNIRPMTADEIAALPARLETSVEAPASDADVPSLDGDDE